MGPLRLWRLYCGSWCMEVTAVAHRQPCLQWVSSLWLQWAPLVSWSCSPIPLYPCIYSYMVVTVFLITGVKVSALGAWFLGHACLYHLQLLPLPSRAHTVCVLGSIGYTSFVAVLNLVLNFVIIPSSSVPSMIIASSPTCVGTEQTSLLGNQPPRRHPSCGGARETTTGTRGTTLASLHAVPCGRFWNKP